MHQPSAIDHELLDVGDGERLERFGPRVVIRPHRGALGHRAKRSAWDAADLRFDRDQGWTGPGLDQGAWTVAAGGGLLFELRPTPAGQVGLYPEHAAQLDWLTDRFREVGRPTVLHLFAYTGLVTLALVRAGAAVTHVDASRPAVDWARRNALLSGLTDRPIRWITDDVRTFVAREIRRGRRYAGIVLDPPTYGHGTGSRAWSLDEDLAPLLAACRAVLDPGGFALLTAHTSGHGPAVLARTLAIGLGRPEREVRHGELALETRDGRRLVLGAFARTDGGAS